MIKRIKPSKPDDRLVDIDDEYALDFWAKELVTSKKKIKEAVVKVGNSVSAIKREIK